MSGLYIRSLVKDGVAVISVINGSTTMTFLGASCISSVRPGTDRLNSITLSPSKGEKAVVALITYCMYSKQPNIIIGGLVDLRWDGDKLIVEEREFISPPDRLGQVMPGIRTLQVTTKGQTFAACWKSYAEELEKQGVRIVEDANMLCRYLVNLASFEELEAVASGDLRTRYEIETTNLKLELRQRREEIARLVARCKSDEEMLKKKNQQIMDLMEELEASKATTESFENEFKRVRDEGFALRTELNNTVGAKWRKFWKSVREVGKFKPGCGRHF